MRRSLTLAIRNGVTASPGDARVPVRRVAPKPRRALWCVAAVLAAVVLVGGAHAPLLRGVVAALIVEDPLEPAAAIVTLGGQVPFRPMEAAELYRAGWAPRIVVVRGARLEEHYALRQLGIVLAEGWEIEREILLRRGVPASAILVPEGEAQGTLEELAIVARAVEPEDKPVILVTSKIHTRRTRMTWEHVTEGHSRPVVRIARGDPFDPEAWWRERRAALAVVREYLGLLNYYAGFPVAATAGPARATP
jgi:uncharacterized SAM-binding protein YcdF (DUF218 family)